MRGVSASLTPPHADPLPASGEREQRRRTYLILAAAAVFAGSGEASWLWLFAYFVVITTGELYLSPIGLSLVSKVAPVRHLAMMMGMWLGTSFIGNLLAGYLGSFWSSMEKPSFFLMNAAIALAAGTVIWAFERPLRPALRGHDRIREAA